MFSHADSKEASLIHRDLAKQQQKTNLQWIATKIDLVEAKKDATHPRK